MTVSISNTLVEQDTEFNWEVLCFSSLIICVCVFILQISQISVDVCIFSLLQQEPIFLSVLEGEPLPGTEQGEGRVVVVALLALSGVVVEFGG